MPFNIDPQTIQKLLFGGPQAAMMSQDQAAPPQPSGDPGFQPRPPEGTLPVDPAKLPAAVGAQPPSDTPPRGSLSSSMPQQQAPAVSAPGYSSTPPTFDEYQATHGDVPLKAPTPAPHRGMLSKIMLGLGEVVGNPYATRIGESDRKLGLENQEFERNKPALQYSSNRAAYEQDLGNLQKVADTRRANIEADIAAQNLPIQEAAEKHYKDLEDAWVNKTVPPEQFDSYAQIQLAAMPDPIRRRVAEHLPAIKALPQTGKGYKLNMQDDMPVSVESYGKTYQPDAKGGFGPEVPPQAVQDFTAAQQAHATKRGEKRQDEAYVAGVAADRQATAFSNQQKTEGQKNATTHLGEMRDAQNQLQLVNQLANSKSPTDQTSLAFKALGLDLPEGVHRINDTELKAIQNQGSLSDRAYRAILNWKTGEAFAPDILEDIKGTAQKIASSKIKAANDKLEDINRVYGYKAPGSGETGRFEASAGGGKAPAAGSVEDGYRFKGGDPGNPKSWEKVK